METTLFKNNLFELGQFVLKPDDQGFNTSGFVDSPLIVFPNNSIWIQHKGKDSFVADPSIINLYNRNQEYSRAVIDQNGDHCIWIKPSEELWDQFVKPDAKDVFYKPYQKCDLQTYLLYKSLISQLSSMDELDIEDSLLTILERVSKVAHCRPKERKTYEAQIKLVQRTKQTIHEHLKTNQSLSDIANCVFSSPYHMTRVFKSITGLGLNQFRNQIRLKKIHNEILNGSTDLASLALEYGYSSHSHLSYNFKRYFGFSPSQTLQKQA